MDRPALLAIPVVAASAVVVVLRSIVTFEAARELLSLSTLALLARPLWTAVAVVGFAAAGYVYGTRTDDTASEVLLVATVASVVGTLAALLILWLTADMQVGMAGGRLVQAGYLGVSVLLDATMFGLLVVGGHALAPEGVDAPAGSRATSADETTG